MRLTNKELGDYINDKLAKMEKEYIETMNMPNDGSDQMCEMKADTKREYFDYKEKNQDEYRYVKLSQLEDLEDDLKLSLDIFVKALLNGVYFKDNKNEIKHSKVKFIAKEKCFALIDKNNKSRGDIRFNNYGKTWALTESELK